MTRRFVVPFGPQLGVWVAIDHSLPEPGLPPGEGTFENVVATVFWRGMG